MVRKISTLAVVMAMTLAVGAPSAFAQLRRADATWTTTTGGGGTAQDTTLELSVNDMGAAIIWMVPHNSPTGGHLSFECSINGGKTWVLLSGSNGDRTQTGVPLSPASSAYDGQEAGWRFPVQGMDKLRVRLDTVITGASASIDVSIRAASDAVAPFGIARQDEPGRLQTSTFGTAVAGTAVTAGADGALLNYKVDEYGVPFVRVDHPNRVTCFADNVGTTRVELSNCTLASMSGVAFYIEEIVAISTTAAASTAQIQEGTGTTCGTGTIGVLPVLSTARLFGYPARTGAPMVINFQTPLKTLASNALCVVSSSATDTLNIMVIGYKGK